VGDSDVHAELLLGREDGVAGAAAEAALLGRVRQAEVRVRVVLAVEHVLAYRAPETTPFSSSMQRRGHVVFPAALVHDAAVGVGHVAQQLVATGEVLDDARGQLALAAREDGLAAQKVVHGVHLQDLHAPERHVAHFAAHWRPAGLEARLVLVARGRQCRRHRPPVDQVAVDASDGRGGRHGDVLTHVRRKGLQAQQNGVALVALVDLPQNINRVSKSSTRNKTMKCITSADCEV